MSKEGDIMKIVSFGGGVQSTALAILAASGKIEVDAFVFCDTGFEQSIVFEFLDKYTRPMLDKAGIPFYIAKTEDYAGQLNGKTVFGNMLLPPFFNSYGNSAIGRLPAYCSSKWKADVFKRFCTKQFKDKDYNVIMGFSTDEIHRAARMKPTKKYNYLFPLLDLRINRGDCIKLVVDKFNAPPPRSSCYFCPNHTQREWREAMSSSDRGKIIEIDNQIRTSLQDKLRGIGAAYLTAECKPIAECDFDDKNEVIFSRLCVGGCFL